MPIIPNFIHSFLVKYSFFRGLLDIKNIRDTIGDFKHLQCPIDVSNRKDIDSGHKSRESFPTETVHLSYIFEIKKEGESATT